MSILFVDDFDDAVINYNFEEAGTAVDRLYTYNAVLEDDEIDENVEGFILYFRFMSNQFNPDDFIRLSHFFGFTLVTIIDNDGRKFFY